MRLARPPLQALSILAALAAAPVAAQSQLVSNTQICNLGPDQYAGELGMILTSSSMEEIEYYCEFDPPIAFDWTSGDHTAARVGYCAEPGWIEPQVFAFQWGDFEPGIVRVYFQGAEQEVVFRTCDGDRTDGRKGQ